MRKDDLKKLIASPHCSQARLYNLVMENSFSELKDSDDITFPRMITALQATGVEPFSPDRKSPSSVISKASKKINDTNLLYLLLTSRTEIEIKRNSELANGSFANFPDVVLTQVLSSYLDTPSMVNLSICTHSLYQKAAQSWRNPAKFIALGLNKEVVENIFRANVIRDYKQLYKTLFRIRTVRDMPDWQVLCLSGEIEALNYAIKKLGLTKHMRGKWGANALHNAAWSGVSQAMHFVIKELNIEVNSLDNFNGTLLHYAAWAGSIPCMQAGLILGVSPSIDNHQRNMLHYSVWSGNVEAARFVKSLGIEIKVDNVGYNLLHCASISRCAEMVRLVRLWEYHYQLHFHRSSYTNDTHWSLANKNKAVIDMLQRPISDILKLSKIDKYKP